MRRSIGLGLMTSLGLGLGVACGGGGGGGGVGGGGPSTTIAKAGAPNGDAQTGTVAVALADSLRVLVLEDGNPKAGASVAWSTTGGGTLSPTSSLTDAAGLAATRWTLGTGAGVQPARATLSGATGSPLNFSATATAGPPSLLTSNAGNNQIGLTSVALAAPISVKVADQFGNGIAGITVDWTVQSGGVQLGSAASTTAVTGVATNTVTGPTAEGAATVRATTTSIAATNVDFSAQFFRALVTVGNTFFRSDRNASQNTAVDTVQVGQKVRWSVTGTHTVESTGTPSFTSSGTLNTGSVYTLVFNAAGEYTYDCAIHGGAMTGRIVVLP